MPRWRFVWLALAAAALCGVLAFCGCSTARRIVEDEGHTYEERETRIFGARVRLVREPVEGRADRIAGRIESMYLWIHRIGLLLGIAGLAACFALRKYGLEAIAYAASALGWTAWGVTGVLLAALAYLWIAVAIVALGGLAAWLLRDRGLGLLAAKTDG